VPGTQVFSGGCGRGNALTSLKKAPRIEIVCKKCAEGKANPLRHWGEGNEEVEVLRKGCWPDSILRVRYVEGKEECKVCIW